MPNFDLTEDEAVEILADLASEGIDDFDDVEDSYDDFDEVEELYEDVDDYYDDDGVF
jgi:hypothetical protein